MSSSNGHIQAVKEHERLRKTGIKSKGKYFLNGYDIGASLENVDKNKKSNYLQDTLDRDSRELKDKRVIYLGIVFFSLIIIMLLG